MISTMKLRIVIVVLVAVGLLSLWATEALLASDNSPSLVPLPQKMERQKGTFALSSSSRVITDAASQPAGDYLVNRLRKSTGYALPSSLQDNPEPGKDCIVLTAKGAGTGKEGYELTVTPKAIVIRGTDEAGVFYGVQTLLQLLPPEIFAAEPAKK